MSELRVRCKAAGIHFLLSAALVSAVMLFCALVWYPGLLVWAAGMASLMVILVAVDLVLGPLLTGIVYKTGKKSLKFDLAVIVAIQLTALFYGVHAIYQARPAYIVFTMDRFEVVAAKDIESDRPEVIQSRFSAVPLTGPTFVGARMPEDRVKRNMILLAKVQAGVGLAMMPEHYVDLNQEVTKHLDKATSLSDLKKFNKADRVESVLSHLQDRSTDLRFFPLVAQDQDMTVVVDKASGSIVDIVDLRPWG